MKPTQQLIFFLLYFITNIYAQQNICSCSCCLYQGCTPKQQPHLTVQTCTLASCLEQCRAYYVECRTAFAGELIAQCFSGPQTTTIATTTTAMTTRSSQTGNLCSCSCCPSNSNCPLRNLGVVWSSTCSSESCDQSCRNQYISSCPISSSLTGTCLSNTGGRTFCDCRCCSNNNQQCIDYRINTNENCQTCSSICQQYSPCQNNNPIITVQRCNQANRSIIINYSNLFVVFFLKFLISK